MTRAIPRALATAGPVALLLVAACGARTPILLDDGLPDAGALTDAPVDSGGPQPPLDATPVEDAMPVPDGAPSFCAPIDPGGACNTLSPIGPVVAVECDGGMPPAPSGGAVVDGSYVMVSSRFFGPCTLDQERIVWNISGQSWATVEELSTGGAASTRTIDGTVSYGGTSLTLTPCCPASGVATTTFGYDATPDSLTLYIYGYGPGRVRVDEFARQ